LNYINQTYISENIKVEFEQIKDIYFSKDGYHVGVRITVSEINPKNIEGKRISMYTKYFDNMVSNPSYHNFVKRFLENAEYRKQYLERGYHWRGSITYSNHKGVNTKCIKTIEKLNGKELCELTHEDFQNLKTYGSDGYTRMTYQKLVELVPTSDIEQVKRIYQDVKNSSRVLRWIARGLKVTHAICKVKIDNEEIVS